jgi:hypothetical protein
MSLSNLAFDFFWFPTLGFIDSESLRKVVVSLVALAKKLSWLFYEWQLHPDHSLT